MAGKKIEQRETNVLGKSREGSFRVKQHLAGFIGSVDGIIVGAEPAVLDNSLVFGGGNIWDFLGPGVLWDGKV